MVNNIRSIVTAVSLVAAFTGSARASSLGIEVISGSTSNTVINTTVGWEFDVTRPITIDALGYYDLNGDGLLNSYPVGIWTTDGELLATATIAAGTNSTLIDSFRFEAIHPIKLTPGSYVIGAVANTSSFSDDRLVDLATITTGDRVVYVRNAASTIQSPDLLFPDTYFPTQGTGFFGPNFTYTPVPEPSSLVLLTVGIGLGVARRRNHL